MPSVLLCQGTALALPLQDASVHCVVTSPPYYGLRDYGTGTWQGGDAACTHVAQQRPAILGSSSTLGYGSANERRRIGSNNNTHEAYTQQYTGICGRCGATRVDAQLGLEASPDAYVAAMVQVFREVKRVLRPDGTLWLNMGDSYNSARGGESGNLPAHTPIYERGEIVYRGAASGLKPKNLLGMPWRLALALQADGWVLRSEIIWHKLNPMPESVQDRPTRAHEQVFLFSKQPHYFYDAEAVREPGSPNTHVRGHGNGQKWSENHGGSKPNDWALEQVEGRACRSVWSLATEPFSGSHFATFPQALVRRCLLAGAPTQVCARCGAPWKREVERGALVPDAPEHRPRGALRPDGLVKRAMHPAGTTQGHPNHHYEYTTTGFSPTCACAAGVGKAVILDPFCGSGTTLFVARELGHHAVGLDLSAEYLRNIARVRLGLTALQEWQEGAAPRQERYDDLPLFGG